MKKVFILIGTRPNFVKITQFKKVAKALGGVDIQIIHSNQHYDGNMSSVFFKQFGIEIDIMLEPFKGNSSEQFGHIMQQLSRIFIENRPDFLLVVGDVNTTLAGALAANKLGIPLGHLESGLRSYDREMPEEINRIITDEISDIYFTTESSGTNNLLKEGRKKENVFFVGNTMIDTLVAYQSQIKSSNIISKIGVPDNPFILMTLHRPSNVDSKESLLKICYLLENLSKIKNIVFPIHPRTKKNLIEHNLFDRVNKLKSLFLTESLDYFSFQKLISEAETVITDSGGIQEETTFLQIPCLTLRNNTERPITISLGTNELMPFNPELILQKVEKNEFKSGEVPELWDGKATNRAIEIMKTYIK